MLSNTVKALRRAGALSAVVAAFAVGTAQATLPAMPNQIPMSDKEKSELRVRAESGNANAQMAMGDLYSDWAGQRPDFIEAIKWYRLAAAHGGGWTDDANAKIATLQDRVDAHKRLYDQAQDGDGQHLYAFALDLPHGAAGIEGDGPMPHWLLRAAEAGHKQAQLAIGTLYFRAAYARRDHAYNQARAAREYTPLPDHITDPAYGYDPLDFDDETPEHDLPNAITWLGKAAETGDTQAQYNLGIAYAATGPTQNVALARDWLHRALAGQPTLAPTACELDYTGKLRLLSTGLDTATSDEAYMVTVDDKPDYSAAFACYDRAKALHPKAYLYLGKMFHRGQGVARDDVRAMQMLQISRTTVFEPDALYEMSLIYRDSHTIGRDPVRAYILLTRGLEKSRAWTWPSCGRPNDDEVEAYRASLRDEMEADQHKLYARLTRSQRLAADNELKREHIWPGHGNVPSLRILEPCV
jgi:hypothetical protein